MRNEACPASIAFFSLGGTRSICSCDRSCFSHILSQKQERLLCITSCRTRERTVALSANDELDRRDCWADILRDNRLDCAFLASQRVVVVKRCLLLVHSCVETRTGGRNYSLFHEGVSFYRSHGIKVLVQRVFLHS